MQGRIRGLEALLYRGEFERGCPQRPSACARLFRLMDLGWTPLFLSLCYLRFRFGSLAARQCVVACVSIVVV